MVDQLAVDQTHLVAGPPAVAPEVSLRRHGRSLSVSTLEAGATAAHAVRDDARLTSTAATALGPRAQAPSWTRVVWTSPYNNSPCY